MNKPEPLKGKILRLKPEDFVAKIYNEQPLVHVRDIRSAVEFLRNNICENVGNCGEPKCIICRNIDKAFGDVMKDE